MKKKKKKKKKMMMMMIIIIIWLSRGDLKIDTESVITVTRYRYYKQNTMLHKYYKQKQITNTTLSTGNENIQHIVSACPKLTKETLHKET